MPGSASARSTSIFPNKAAILFRLQTEEWAETRVLLRRILEDRSQPPFVRLRRLVHAFIRSECEEAEMRGALDAAAPFYNDAPEAQAARARDAETMRAFMAEALPEASPATQAMAGNLVKMMLGDIGKRLSEDRALAGEIEAYADAVADLFTAYLETLR